MTVEAGTTEATGSDAPATPGGRARRRWCLGTRLLVLGTVVWALFLVSHWLVASHWWVWLVVEALPPATFVVVPLAMLAVSPLARPVRRWLPLCLVALISVGLMLTGVRLPTTDGTPASGDLSVFAWNTDTWEMSDGTEAFYDYLRRQDADVYLLQEYLYWGDGPVRIDHGERLSQEFPGYEVVTEGELVTLSRVPVVATHRRDVPAGDGNWYWQGAKAQRTDVLVDGATVSVYNVHMPVPYRWHQNPLTGEFLGFVREQYDRRDREFSALRADLSGNPHPALVVGDFNSAWVPTLVPVAPELRHHDPDTGSWWDRWWPTSWPTDTYPFPRLWRLDHAFTTPGIGVDSYALVDSRSDHRAQELQVSLT